MRLIETQDREQFTAFVRNHPYGQYMKTPMWGEYKKKTEHTDWKMLVYTGDDGICGTAMVLIGRWMTHKYIYVPWGPCIDYENAETVKEAFALLKDYAQSEGAVFLRTDPNVVRVPHDIQGNVLEGFNHEYVTEILKETGYRHKGYGYAYDGSWTNRYTLMVDLSPDMETIKKRFSAPRRRAINRHELWAVTSRIGDASDLPVLMDFEKQLSEQDGFCPHKREFFQSLLDAFGKDAVIYVASVDLDRMLENTARELTGKKYRKDPEARQGVEKTMEKAKELRVLYGSKVDIAAGLFIRFGANSWDLYTYNHKDFNFLNSVDAIHALAMEDMKKHGVLHYDMVGFSGVTTKDDPEYGLYFYKSSFGPEYIERLGQFDAVFKANRYRRFDLERRGVNKVRRKVVHALYAKKNKGE